MIGLDHAAERVNEDVVIVAIVVSPLQFFEVAVDMLDGDLMECAHERTLEQRPHALDGVRVHVAHDPFIDGVVDALVLVSHSEIECQFISVDGICFVADDCADECVERGAPDVGELLQADRTLSLDSAGNPDLVAAIAPARAALLAAYQRFVHFDHAQASSR